MEITSVAYDRDNFNFLMRILEWFIEENVTDFNKNVIRELLLKIRDNHSFYMEGQTKIVLNFTNADLMNIMYVYESVLFNTAEGRIIMRKCHDYFGEFKSKA